MLPKTEFNKLKKYVLDYLKRNSDGNGFCHIAHGALGGLVMYSKVRFSGSREQREENEKVFWEALLKTKSVEMVMAPVDLAGKEKPHYFLPGTKPFHDSSLKLFDEVRKCNRSIEGKEPPEAPVSTFCKSCADDDGKWCDHSQRLF